MKSFISLSLALSASVMCFAYTGGKDDKKFTTDLKTGVRYHFFKHNKTGITPKEDDVAQVILMYHNDKDSLIYDSRTAKNRRHDDTVGEVMIPLKTTFKGCLEQGIEMMAVGDSAEFKINTDSLFFKTFHAKALPAYAHGGTDLDFFIRLVSFKTQEQLKAEQQQQMQKQQMELEKRKAEEKQTIAKYLNDNHLQVQPTADSLYFLSRQDGTGKKIESGDSVAVKYTGMLLNGTIFDATDRHGPSQQTFKFQFSNNMPLIKGWVLAFATMHEGDKVRILIPSALAYGARQASADILPYSPLIFDIEVVKVTPQN
jgi:FKBP-type peptidyl-prolyl cis-trans isomerase FkpA